MKLLLALLSIVFLAACDSDAYRKNPDGIDVDLTRLSSTMVYSEVSNMLATPQRYAGKVIRMKGKLNLDGYSGKKFCIIADATACCSQGVEFLLSGEAHPAFPNYNMMMPPSADEKKAEMPENGSNVTVVGTFAVYVEGGQPNIILTEAAYQY